MNSSNYKKYCLVFGLTLFIVGCGSAEKEELQQWMAQERANTKPNIKPLEEPKVFKPQDYSGADSADPFNNQRLLQILRKESSQNSTNASLLAPELNRRKEPLESEPLDSMAMVGSLNKKGTPTALLKIGGLLYQVKVGNYLGQNYGKITQITENSIRLREIVQDGTGDWIERISSLELQEGKK